MRKLTAPFLLARALYSARALSLALFLSGCPSEVPTATPVSLLDPVVDAGVDAQGGPSPEEMVAERDLFTTRCSKCHSLGRILDLGVRDETFWRRYVHRMRLQPGSGIAEEEEKPILRHLVRVSESKRALPGDPKR